MHAPQCFIPSQPHVRRMIAGRALLIQADWRKATRIIKKVADQPPLATADADALVRPHHEHRRRGLQRFDLRFRGEITLLVINPDNRQRLLLSPFEPDT